MALSALFESLGIDTFSNCNPTDKKSHFCVSGYIYGPGSKSNEITRGQNRARFQILLILFMMHEIMHACRFEKLFQIIRLSVFKLDKMLHYWNVKLFCLQMIQTDQKEP